MQTLHKNQSAPFILGPVDHVTKWDDKINALKKYILNYFPLSCGEQTTDLNDICGIVQGWGPNGIYIYI